MLFQTSIRKELARSFGATLVVILTIVMTIVLIRALGQASRGFISPQGVMLYIAYAGLGRLPTILSLSLFIALVATLSRMYRDSEMVIWFSSGRGLKSFLAPLLHFSWPVLLLVTLLSLFVWPWTNQQSQTMKLRFENRGDLDRIAPGQFQESSSGNRVFFIERNAGAGEKASSNVFIATNENGKSAITTARNGRVEMQQSGPVLVLQDGQRIESVTGTPAYKISEFAEYGSKGGGSGPQSAEVTASKMQLPAELIAVPTPANLSELAWRLGLALSALNLVLLALALASVNPRGGRSSNLAFVLLSFVVYNNLVNLGQNWILAGRIGFAEFLLALHGGVFVLALAWLAKRHFAWTLRDALPGQWQQCRQRLGEHRQT